MKAFFSKIWAWIVSHKVIAIIVASAVVVGSTCAIVLPIALHEHSYSAEWSTDAENHWHGADCNHTEEKSDIGAHAYKNACDTTCETCGYIRVVGAHVYDNDCDTKCNVCDAERTVGAHVYDNACDTDCNECGATRTITHDHADTLTAGETTHWYACSVCGDKKDETSHVFDKTVANSEYLKAEATATTKAQYYKSCVCGAKSATEYFEIDKALANLQVSDISKTYDGTPVAEPTVTFDGVGAENFAYYKGDEMLTERPTDAGTYKVVVTVDETDTHAGDRVEREFTIAKKTLNYLELTKVYNGKRGFGENAGVYCQLGVEHGVIAGDTVFLETSDDVEYNVGKYYFVRMNSTDDRDTVWLLGDDAANYDFRGNDVVGEVAVTKRAIWTTGVTFEYGNCTTYTGEESPNVEAIVFQNTVAGETIAYDYVEWTFADVNVGAKLADVTLYPESDAVQANYEIDLSKCEAEIVKAKISFSVKVNDKTYDGESIDFNDVKYTSHPIFVDLSTATIDFKLEDEGEDHYGINNTPADAGEYIVRVGISETENYESYIAYATFTISPKVINNVKVDFTYDGSDYQQVVLTSADHSDILGSDQVTLEVCFATPDVDSAVDTSSPEMAPAFNDDNYVLGTYEFSIVPKALTGALILDVYYGDVKKLADSELYYYDQVISETEYGVLTDESVTIRVLYANPNAGTANTSFAIYGESNYVIGDLSVNNTTISQKIVTELPTTLKVEYNGTNKFTTEIEVDGIIETLSFDAPSHVKVISNYDNCEITNASLGDNYLLEIDESVKYRIEIGKKKISNLDLRVTYDTYNNHYVDLLAKDGIVEGQEVRLMIGYNHPTTLPVGTVLTIQESLGALHGEFYEVIASVMGANTGNYELVATEDEHGHLIYGTLTIVESCEIQENGDCACGGHITPLTLGSPQVVSDQGVTAGEATYFSFTGNSGIYRISDYVVGTASPWATITVSLENGTAVEPVREDEYFFKYDTVYRIKAVATNTLDYDTVMIKVVEAPVTTMENPNPSNVTSKLITVNLTAGSTGGWYKVYVESGSYYLSSSTAFLKSGGLVYNSKGERVETFTGTNYWLEEGTHYFYIPLKGDLVTDTSKFYLNRNGMELDCQSAYVLSKSVKENEKMYIKVNGEEGSMNEFTVAGDMDDEVRFTYEAYGTIEDLIAGNPYHQVTEPTNEIWQDVNYTSDCIFVIKITTGGSIIINVA